jgi:hypothetical protein
MAAIVIICAFANTVFIFFLFQVFNRKILFIACSLCANPDHTSLPGNPGRVELFYNPSDLFIRECKAKNRPPIWALVLTALFTLKKSAQNGNLELQVFFRDLSFFPNDGMGKFEIRPQKLAHHRSPPATLGSRR